MQPMKTLTAIAIAVVATAATIPPSEAYTQRIPAQAGATSSIPPSHATTGSGFRLPPSCHPYKPGCLHIKGDKPSAPKKTGNGTPNTGINCTYTTHGMCSPD